jgi:hypothetical protein
MIKDTCEPIEQTSARLRMLLNKRRKQMEYPTYELTPELKEKIDNMSHYDMCATWRFAKSGNPLIMGETGQYFEDRLFNHFGGFTPEISKSLGW